MVNFQVLNQRTRIYTAILQEHKDSFHIPSYIRYRVTVVAEQFASPVSGKRITSEIAGALWEWPPAVCGSHTDEESLERAKVWCLDSYAKFVEMAMSAEETGVFVKQSVFYFKDKVEDTPVQLHKMNELRHLPGFQHDENLIDKTGRSSTVDSARGSFFKVDFQDLRSVGW